MLKSEIVSKLKSVILFLFMLYFWHTLLCRSFSMNHGNEGWHLTTCIIFNSENARVANHETVWQIFSMRKLYIDYELFMKGRKFCKFTMHYHSVKQGITQHNAGYCNVLDNYLFTNYQVDNFCDVNIIKIIYYALFVPSSS